MWVRGKHAIPLELGLALTQSFPAHTTGHSQPKESPDSRVRELDCTSLFRGGSSVHGRVVSGKCEELKPEMQSAIWESRKRAQSAEQPMRVPTMLVKIMREEKAHLLVFQSEYDTIY